MKRKERANPLLCAAVGELRSPTARPTTFLIASGDGGVADRTPLGLFHHRARRTRWGKWHLRINRPETGSPGNSLEFLPLNGDSREKGRLCCFCDPALDPASFELAGYFSHVAMWPYFHGHLLS